MGWIGASADGIGVRRTRRRRTPAHAARVRQLPAVPAPPVPAIQPVPGTAAAQQAAEAAERLARQRPHVLLDPDIDSRPPSPKAGMPDMSPDEIAGRIVAALLQGSGPILLTVPGTLGASYESSMRATARAFAQARTGPISVASIPYPNGVFDVVTRFFNIGTQVEKNVLALVLKRLRVAAPNRPVLLAGESQGAWLIAQTLREDPSLAEYVTRIALFAKPGFVQMPQRIGGAQVGAALLGAPSNTGVLEYRHVDDIVPSLFNRLGSDVFRGYVEAIAAWRRTGEYEYPPHHYDVHGMEAARWLLFGERPTAPTTHHSKAHRPT